MKILDQNLQLSSQTQFSQQQELAQGRDRYVGGQIVSSEAAHELSQMSRIDSHSNHNRVVTSRTQESQHNLADKSEQTFSPSQERLREPSRELSGAWNRFLAPNLQAIQSSQEAPPLPEHLMKMVEVIEGWMGRMTGKPYRMQVYGYQRESEAYADSNHQKVSQSVGINPSAQIGGFEGAQRGQIGDAAELAPVEGVRVYRQASFYESQSLRFAATGNVLTKEGQQISFAFESQISREFASSVQYEQQQGLVATDPLVVNFGGQNAQLSFNKVAFDLNADGQTERVNFLQAGSGFLALDKNGNGQIDDGSELFGPQTGNGFADLSAYDEDANGWIDENDPVFANLQIWHQDANGLQQLDGLLALNVGAIALQNVRSDFAYKDDDNQTQALIRTSSVFLKEEGGVGSIQQIDWVV